jgi:hypothetical protein
VFKATRDLESEVYNQIFSKTELCNKWEEIGRAITMYLAGPLVHSTYNTSSDLACFHRENHILATNYTSIKDSQTTVDYEITIFLTTPMPKHIKS